MLLLPQDRKEAAAIERRRRNEEERKSRIFDFRFRTIGIDKDALEKQVEERRKREEEERKVNAAFARQRNREAELALLLEKRFEEERRKINEEINDFRAKFQQRESRREFDINDPDILKKSLPARLYDEDPRCGISSAQKFEGEDLGGKERSKFQHEQIRSWLEQQMAERKVADEQRKAADLAYDAAVLEMDRRACELDRLEHECRRRLDEAHQNFNRVMAVEQAHEKQMEHVKDVEDQQAEIYNLLTGNFLSEDPEAAMSSFGPHRIVGSLFKGLTPKQLEEIRKKQLEQIEEKKKMEEEEVKRNAQWDSMINNIAKQSLNMDFELMQKQREINRQIMEQNKRLSEEQKTQMDYLKKVVYCNTPTAAFFEQFNKGTR